MQSLMSFLYLWSNTPQSLHYITATLAKKKEKKEEEISILITSSACLVFQTNFMLADMPPHSRQYIFKMETYQEGI